MGNGTFDWRVGYQGTTSGTGGNEFRVVSTGASGTGRFFQFDHDGNFELSGSLIVTGISILPILNSTTATITTISGTDLNYTNITGSTISGSTGIFTVLTGSTLNSTTANITTANVGTLNVTNNSTLNDLTVQGNLTVLGTSFSASVQTVLIEDNILVINDGETGAGVTSGFAGIEVDRGSATDFHFLFRESDDRFVVGISGSLQVVATRMDDTSMTSFGIPFYNASAVRFDTDANLVYSGSIVTLNGTLRASTEVSSSLGTFTRAFIPTLTSSVVSSSTGLITTLSGTNLNYTNVTASQIQLVDYIVHQGDLDAYFGFNANDTYQIATGGKFRFSVGNNYAYFGAGANTNGERTQLRIYSFDASSASYGIFEQTYPTDTSRRTSR